MKRDYPTPIAAHPVRYALAIGVLAAIAMTADATAMTVQPAQAAPGAPAAPTAPAAPSAPVAPGSFAAPMAHPTPPPAPPPPPLDRKQASYDFGLTFGEQLRRNNLNNEVDVEHLTRGLRDGLAGKKIEPPDQQGLRRYVVSVRESIAPRNRQAAHDFLQKNGHAKGVITQPSGLQYKVVAAGDAKGTSPQPVDEVTVNYRGKLLDGTEFDSSYARGQPATMQASRVIKGWQEALSLMKPGDKWQIFVPPELGYDLNSPPGIPPGSLLIFDIELMRVDSPPAPANVPAAPIKH
jgi:FKBP-type peptidyl-prolyl cis-trans isomerase FklB